MRTLGAGEMRALYRFLYLTRALEERFERLFKQGQIVGGLYRSLGQEATAVGSAYALGDGDWLSPSIRDMGALLVRGLDPRDMLLQYMARSGSLCRGKDNTTHFTVPELGLLGPISPLGTQLCVLNGIALALRNSGEDRVCLTYQGDGASRTGASHEGMSFAAAQRLPIVIVLEHNGWAFSTRSEVESAVADWANVGLAYGMPTTSVDGNDVLAVFDAAIAAVDRARQGGGPSLIVAETYRMLGHAQHDPQKYVPEGELELWQRKDPITRYEGYLREQEVADDDALRAIRDSVDEELADAVDDALATPMPSGEEALTDVYGPGFDPREIPWTRRDVVGYPELPVHPSPRRERVS